MRRVSGIRPRAKWNGVPIKVRRLSHDGVRRAGDSVQILTRNGHDWSDRMPKVRDTLKALPTDAWLDGEAVVLDANGHPDLNALQNAFDRRSSAKVVLFVFDLLWIGGSRVRSGKADQANAPQVVHYAPSN
jgi:hypothetical protein